MQLLHLFCSILNESIPKDEADQLLQDLFHEMSMYSTMYIVKKIYPEVRARSLLSDVNLPTVHTNAI